MNRSRHEHFPTHVTLPEPQCTIRRYCRHNNNPCTQGLDRIVWDQTSGSAKNFGCTGRPKGRRTLGLNPWSLESAIALPAGSGCEILHSTETVTNSSALDFKLTKSGRAGLLVCELTRRKWLVNLLRWRSNSRYLFNNLDSSTTWVESSGRYK